MLDFFAHSLEYSGPGLSDKQWLWTDKSWVSDKPCVPVAGQTHDPWDFPEHPYLAFCFFCPLSEAQDLRVDVEFSNNFGNDFHVVFFPHIEKLEHSGLDFKVWKQNLTLTLQILCIRTSIPGVREGIEMLSTNSKTKL